jgi:Inner membrane component of T3SS, cytoplasmic domain
MSEKIRISLDDVNSLDVDRKLKQQDAVARTTVHYQQQVATSMPSMARNSGRSVLRNTLATAAILGLVGGIIAWIAGEIVFYAMPNPLEEMMTVALMEAAINDSVNRGALGQAEADHRLKQLYDEHRNNPYLRTYLDEAIPEKDRTRRIEEQIEKDKARSFIQQMIWFSVLGIPIAFFLALCDGVTGRNWHACIVNGSVGIVLGLLGGVIVGLFINQLYAAMGGSLEDRSLTRQILARAVGWAILGLFLAIAPGIVLRNTKRSLIGLAGGFAGGLLGGLLFDPISFVTENAVVSRLVAIVAISLVAGVGTGILENVAKTGWMKVDSGLIAGKQFIIYKNPTVIGSSPQCEIYLFKDVQIEPKHAAIRQVPQGYELQDLGTRSGTFVNGSPITRVRLRNNDQIQIGGTTFTFQEKSKTHES